MREESIYFPYGLIERVDCAVQTMYAVENAIDDLTIFLSRTALSIFREFRTLTIAFARGTIARVARYV